MGTNNIGQLMAISPLDGRYQSKCAELSPYFSEFALMRYRVEVEVRWLQKLTAQSAIKELPEISAVGTTYLDRIVTEFSLDDAERIKDIEATTNHDVKAVEYFLKQKLSTQTELVELQEFVHFACTSEDINNLAHGLMLKKRSRSSACPST